MIFATFNHVTEKYTGKVYTPGEITDMFGPPEEIAIERLVGKERIDGAMDDFFTFYEKNHRDMASAYDGIVEMLEFLKSKGILLAVFTGKGKRSTLISLDILGIKNYFDFIITGSDVENHKPSAEGIRKVITRFGLEAEEVLMVGDAVADVKAAHDAGVKIAAVLWDSYGKDKVMEMQLDHKFHNVPEFIEWLKHLFNGERRFGE